MEITTEIDFDITCSVCGSYLEIDKKSWNERRKEIVLIIQPCKKCLTNAEDEGYKSGERTVFQGD